MNLKDISGANSKAASSANRYALLRTAQGILAKTGATWKEQHRTCWCSRSLKRGNETVDVFRNEARDGASLTGLNRCGNLHTCPICAAKVSELRRKQLSSAMVEHVKNGGAAYLLTQTFPHDADMPLAELMAKFDKARQKFQNCREWKAFQKASGNITVKRRKNGEMQDVVTTGTVNSLEFTVSQENGWHPHVHMLVFCKRKGFGADEKIITEENGLYVKDDIASNRIEDLKAAWVDILFKVGLGDHTKLTEMKKRALNVRGGEKAAEYIAKFGRDEKWGASSELARSHAKIGAAGERWGVLHFTPFQLLVWAGQGDTWAVHRFREYAEAVEGKRALTWSQGLKNALGVADVDEDEWVIQDEPQPDQVMVGTLTAEQYALILSRKQVPQFLEYAATCAHDQADLDDYCEALKAAPKVASGALLARKFMGSGKSVIYA